VNLVGFVIRIWLYKIQIYLVTSLSLWRPKFIPGLVYVRCVVECMALGQVFFLWLSWLSPVTVSQQMAHTEHHFKTTLIRRPSHQSLVNLQRNAVSTHTRNPILYCPVCRIVGAMYHICDLSLVSLQQLRINFSLKFCELLSCLQMSLEFSLCCNEKFTLAL
jgi:hypothetical protein